MTNQQILERSITKAIDGGWDFFGWTDDDEFSVRVIYSEDADDRHNPLCVITDSSMGEYGWDPSIIIFNHSFARALWGEDVIDQGSNYDGEEVWRYHLQEMVISSDPVKYLGENI